MGKLSRYIYYGALIGAAWAVGEIVGELIIRRLENSESNLKDDETDPTEGKLRETIIPNPVASSELCTVTITGNIRNRFPARISMPGV